MKRSMFALVSAALFAIPEIAAAQVPPSLFVPSGTLLMVRTTDRISSDASRAGDGFIATLAQPVVVDGWVLARTGQTVVGRVAIAEKAGRVSGSSTLALELSELILVDGQQLPVRTQLIQSDGPTSHGNDVTTIATGAGLGTLIGLAVDGGRGAAIGAAIGGGAGVAGALSTRGRATEVAPETLLTFRLEAPLGVSTERSRQAFFPVTAADYNTGVPTLRIPERRVVERVYTLPPPRPVVVYADPYPYPYPYVYSTPTVIVSRPVVVPRTVVVVPSPPRRDDRGHDRDRDRGPAHDRGHDRGRR